MPTNLSQRKVFVIVLVVCFLVLGLALAALNAFNFKFLNPATTQQIFLFTALSVIAFILFVAVLVLLLRNILKLYADQRSRVLGARLRTRMLWGALLLSLLPIAFMFAFSYLLMNRAVDRWFSQPVTALHDDSARIALQLSSYAAANARAEAESIAATLRPDPLRTLNADQPFLTRKLQQHDITLQGGFALIYRDAKPIFAYHLPTADGTSPSVRTWSPPQSMDDAEESPDIPAANQQALSQPINASIYEAAQRTDSPLFTLSKSDYALGTAWVRQGGAFIVVALPMPPGLNTTLNSLRSESDAYWRLYRLRRQVRNLYMLLLLMMTCLALFISSWLALHLSKQVTKPVEALADAMDEIAAGHYAHRVSDTATEELGELVKSFNHMASDLENSRAQVEQSNLQLSLANASIEARRRELETMLETIPNGVVLLDAQRRIVLANRAFSELMDPGGQQPFLQISIDSIFPADVLASLDRLIRRSHRMGTASAEIEMASRSGTLNIAATVGLLESAPSPLGERTPQGYVLVLEDATQLLRAQKQSAWKEVARRVAHEIKNPLTPISLSAEQIRRHIDRLDTTITEHQIESPSTAIIRRCSEVISASVENMRSLVDQFSSLAEFPSAQLRPADLNTIVENSLALFAGRLKNITVTKRLAPNLPLVLADPEALKRALSNLVDNAAEAMQSSLLRELRISTALSTSNTDGAGELIELVVADTGPGLTDDIRERLFLPYFSTKQRGTGLGLAIAAKIMQEHQGSIRAEKNSPAGARFILELRPAPDPQKDLDFAEPGIQLPATAGDKA